MRHYTVRPACELKPHPKDRKRWTTISLQSPMPTNVPKFKIRLHFRNRSETVTIRGLPKIHDTVSQSGAKRANVYDTRGRLIRSYTGKRVTYSNPLLSQ